MIEPSHDNPALYAFLEIVNTEPNMSLLELAMMSQGSLHALADEAAKQLNIPRNVFFHAMASMSMAMTVRSFGLQTERGIGDSVLGESIAILADMFNEAIQNGEIAETPEKVH